MFFNFQTAVIAIWDFWCGLFGLLPYGDPYLATFVLVVIMAATVKAIAGGESA